MLQQQEESASEMGEKALRDKQLIPASLIQGGDELGNSYNTMKCFLFPPP